MNAQERILALRLKEKVDRNPQYAQRIGVTVVMTDRTERDHRLCSKEQCRQ